MLGILGMALSTLGVVLLLAGAHLNGDISIHPTVIWSAIVILVGGGMLGSSITTSLHIIAQQRAAVRSG